MGAVESAVIALVEKFGAARSLTDVKAIKSTTAPVVSDAFTTRSLARGPAAGTFRDPGHPSSEPDLKGGTRDSPRCRLVSPFAPRFTCVDTPSAEYFVNSGREDGSASGRMLNPDEFEGLNHFRGRYRALLKGGDRRTKCPRHVPAGDASTNDHGTRNKLVFAGLALGCLGAAAGGGYLAARQSDPVAVRRRPFCGARSHSGRRVESGCRVRRCDRAGNDATGDRGGGRAGRTRRDPGPARTTPAVERRPATSSARPASTPARRETPAETRSARREAPARQETPAPASSSSSGGAWEVRPSVEPERASVTPEPEAPPAPAEPESLRFRCPRTRCWVCRSNGRCRAKPPASRIASKRASPVTCGSAIASRFPRARWCRAQ